MCSGCTSPPVGNICPCISERTTRSAWSTGDDGVSAMLCIGAGQLCTWGSWAVERPQRLALIRISASEADERAGSSTHLDGKTPWATAKSLFWAQERCHPCWTPAVHQDGLQTACVDWCKAVCGQHCAGLEQLPGLSQTAHQSGHQQPGGFGV